MAAAVQNATTLAAAVVRGAEPDGVDEFPHATELAIRLQTYMPEPSELADWLDGVGLAP